MCLPTPDRTGPAGLAEPGNMASSLPWKCFLRIAPRPHLYAVLICASLLLFLASASLPAQQQTAGLEPSRSALPETPLPKTPAEEGLASVAGTVLDLSGATVSGADVNLMRSDGTQSHAMLSNANGEFGFLKILPGSYLVAVNAKGFAPFTSVEFLVADQQVYELPDISLSVATASIEVMVRPTDLIAAEQIRAAEKQRLIGVIPNFYTSYIYDAAPLSSKQKFSLAARGTFDPVSMIGVASAPASSRLITPIPGTDKAPRDTANVLPQSLSTDAAVISSLMRCSPRSFTRTRATTTRAPALLSPASSTRSAPHLSHAAIVGVLCPTTLLCLATCAQQHYPICTIPSEPGGEPGLQQGRRWPRRTSGWEFNP